MTMSTDQIILYDLPSRGKPACWSLNPWKARAALNFKSIPYTTEWIEYPDLAPTFKSVNIPPNTSEVNPNAEYSIPVAKFPDGGHIMDSLAIVKELEKLQPEPSLHLNQELDEKTQCIILDLNKALAPICMPRVPEMILNSRSADYFYETRKARWGMPLQELAKSKKAKNAWSDAEEPLRELKGLLTDKDGKYVQGEDASFADLIVAGFWRFMEKLDKDGDVFGRLMKEEVFRKHYGGVKVWLEKDD